MAGYKKWRINVTANNGDGAIACSLFNVVLKNSSGSVISTVPATITASSNYGGYAPGRAFDGNPNTEWASANGTFPANIVVSFPDNVDVRFVEITQQSNNDGLPRSPKNFTIDCSYDGITWITLATMAGISWSAGVMQSFQLPVAYRLSGSITESLAITDWLISVSQCRDGKQIGHSVISATSYSIDCLCYEITPCNITLSPKIDYAWTASKVCAVNDYVVPANPDTTPHLFKVTAITGDAKFGATEPTYNLSGTTTSGNVTLTYIAPLVDPVTLGPKIPTPI